MPDLLGTRTSPVGLGFSRQQTKHSDTDSSSIPACPWFYNGGVCVPFSWSSGSVVLDEFAMVTLAN